MSTYIGFLQSQHVRTAAQGFVQLRHAIERNGSSAADEYVRVDDAELSMLTQWLDKTDSAQGVLASLFDVLALVLQHTTLNVSAVVQRIVSSHVILLSDSLHDGSPAVVRATLRLLRALNTRNSLVLYQKLRLKFDKCLWCGRASTKRVADPEARRKEKEEVSAMRHECVAFLLSYLSSHHDDVSSYALQYEGLLEVLTSGLKSDNAADALAIVRAISQGIRARKIGRVEKIKFLTPRVLENIVDGVRSNDDGVVRVAASLLREIVGRLHTVEFDHTVGFVSNRFVTHILCALEPWASVPQLRLMEAILRKVPTAFESYAPHLLMEVARCKNPKVTQCTRMGVLLALERLYSCPLPNYVKQCQCRPTLEPNPPSVYWTTPERMRTLALGGSLTPIANVLLSPVDAKGTHRNDFEVLMAVQTVLIAARRVSQVLQHLEDAAVLSATVDWSEFRRACHAGLIEWFPPSSVVITRRKTIITELDSLDETVQNRAVFFYERMCEACMELESVYENVLFKYLSDAEFIDRVPGTTQGVIYRLIRRSPALPVYLTNLLFRANFVRLPPHRELGRLFSAILRCFVSGDAGDSKWHLLANEGRFLLKFVGDESSMVMLSHVMNAMLQHSMQTGAACTLRDAEKGGVVYRFATRLLKDGKLPRSHEEAFGGFVSSLKLEPIPVDQVEPVADDDTPNTKPLAPEQEAVVVGEKTTLERSSLIQSVTKTLFEGVVQISATTTRGAKYVTLASECNTSDLGSVHDVLMRMVAQKSIVRSDIGCMMWMWKLLNVLQNNQLPSGWLPHIAGLIADLGNSNKGLSATEEVQRMCVLLVVTESLRRRPADPTEQDKESLEKIAEWLLESYTFTLHPCDTLTFMAMRCLGEFGPTSCPELLRQRKFGQRSEAEALDNIVALHGARVVSRTVENFHIASEVMAYPRGKFYTGSMTVLDPRTVLPCLYQAVSLAPMQPRTLITVNILISRFWVSLALVGMQSSDNGLRVVVYALLQRFADAVSSFCPKYFSQWAMQGVNSPMQRIPAVVATFMAMTLPHVATQGSSLNGVLWKEILQSRSWTHLTIPLMRSLQYNAVPSLRVFALRYIKCAMRGVTEDDLVANNDNFRSVFSQILFSITMPSGGPVPYTAAMEALRACTLSRPVVRYLIRVFAVEVALSNMLLNSLSSTINAERTGGYTTACVACMFWHIVQSAARFQTTPVLQVLEQAHSNTTLPPWARTLCKVVAGAVKNAANEGTDAAAVVTVPRLTVPGGVLGDFHDDVISIFRRATAKAHNNAGAAAPSAIHD